MVVVRAAASSGEGNGVAALAVREFAETEAAAFDAWVGADGDAMIIAYACNEAGEIVNVNAAARPARYGPQHH